MYRTVLNPALRTAVGLLVALLLATPAAHATAHTDAVLGRLVHGRGLSVDQPRPVTDAELRHYARFLALDLQADPPTVRLWMRLAPEGHAAVQALGIPLLARVGNLASARVPLSRLAALAQAPGVLSLEAAHRLRAELDVSLPEIGADLGHDQYNARGAGTVVGIVDDGIDFAHADFRHQDGSTRIKFLWNQALLCGNPAPGFGYGCLYTESDINNALNGMGTVTVVDTQGHGTHVTGVATGNGLQTGNSQPAGTYVGMAPEADIIYVKNTVNLVSCAQCDLGDALLFIDQKAAELGKPWATNVSLGQDFGGHDASDPFELVIDSLIGAGVPGKVVVKSAGNNRIRGIHISGTVARNRSNEHTFTLPAYTPNPGVFNDVHIFSLWYENADDLTVRLTAPGGGFHQSRTGDGLGGTATSDGAIVIDDRASPTALGTRFFDIEIDDQDQTPPSAGTWTLRVTGNSVAGGGHYDAWIWFSELGDDSADWDNPDFAKLVTLPGTSFDVTTVGAYVSRTDWTDVTGTPQSFADTLGSLAFFSSPGLTRDNRQKPEISAPGQVILSSLASAANPFLDEIAQDGEHWVLLGTSFSAPHITGLYAQMLGLNPDLDALQLRTMIQETARSDGFTGAVPNADWGYGKVDAKAALDMVVKPVTNLHWTSTTHYMWDSIAPLATTYNVYRARISDLDGTFYGNCRASGLTTPSVNESLTPPLGDGFFFLITGVKDGIEGLRGFQSDGTPRNQLNVCP